MSFEADLKSHLQADGGISGIVGGKIFPLVLPESVTLPAVTYTVVTGEPQNSLDGFVNGTTRYLVQIDCWAKSYNSVLALALAVRDRLKTNASTFSVVIDEFPLLDAYEDDVKVYRRALQVACWFKE